MLRGSTEILNTVCDTLGGIKPGQTTKDGKFTVIEVECQGACSNAPMMVIGDDFYVRNLPWWNVCVFLIAPPPSPVAGGSHCRDNEEDTGRVLKRAETKPWPTERPPDKREFGGVDRAHIQGLFPPLVLAVTLHHSSSLMVPENSVPRNLVRLPNTHIRWITFRGVWLEVLLNR